jgi:hypothetical protein
MARAGVVRLGFVALVGAGLVVVAEPAALAGGQGVTGLVSHAASAIQPSAQANSASGTPMVGTFRVAAGSCSGAVSGSWFRMLSPAGSPVSNSDSSCSDQTYTPLTAGSDGGLVTGSYQPEPSPAFDGSGNGLAHAILQPTKFYGVGFAAATDRTDPQTGTSVPAPTVSNNGGSLNGDLRAFTVAWNNQHFNQGSPKPDGSRPGRTSGPSGTYDASTGAFKLTWSSQIVGGPFNNFTGEWQLVGTFVASGYSAPGGSTAGSSGTSSSPTTGYQPSSSASDATSAASPAGTGGPALPTTGGTFALAPAAGLLAAGLGSRWLSRRRSSRKDRS